MSWYFYLEELPGYLDVRIWQDQGLKVDIEQEGIYFKATLTKSATWIPDDKMPDFFKNLVKQK